MLIEQDFLFTFVGSVPEIFLNCFSYLFYKIDVKKQLYSWIFRGAGKNENLNRIWLYIQHRQRYLIQPYPIVSCINTIISCMYTVLSCINPILSCINSIRLSYNLDRFSIYWRIVLIVLYLFISKYLYFKVTSRSVHHIWSLIYLTMYNCIQH